MAKKKALNRPSQITGTAPSARLKARRKANTKKGYFPNPTDVAKAYRAPLTRAKTSKLVGHVKIGNTWRKIVETADSPVLLESIRAFLETYQKESGKECRLIRVVT